METKEYLNGTEYKAQLEQKTDKDSGEKYYEETFEDIESELEFSITGDDSKKDSYNVTVNMVTVVEENGKIYLVDGKCKLDITEDAKDGSATGIYENDEMVYEYEVMKKDGIWNVKVSDKCVIICL